MTTQIVWPEERYSSFYKRQLRLCILDDFSAFSGGVHKYTDHVVREILKGLRRGIVKDFEMSWVESPNLDQPFNGRNIRNLLGGKDSQFAIWAVFDVYMKLTQPILAGGFSLEGHLERLGLVVSDFIDPGPNAKRFDPTEGFYSANEENSRRLHLSVDELPGRRFKLVHLIHEMIDDNKNERDAANGDRLKDLGTRVDRGVLVPQFSGALLMVRDVETAEVNLGFVNDVKNGLTLSLVSERVQRSYSMMRTTEPEATTLLRARGFGELEQQV